MEKEIFLSFWVLLVIAYMGMFSHFLKKKVRGETATAIARYFIDHVKTTILAVIVTLIGYLGYYFTLKTGQLADILAVFTIGYMFDSMFNKFEGKDEGEIKGDT